MVKRARPTFFDRVIAFATGKLPAEVARKRGHFEPSKSATMPTERTYEQIPRERVIDFNTRTHSMQDLEWIIMTPNEPLQVRRAAAEEWARVAPKPLRPNIPYLSGVGHDPFWRAFRDAYREQELW